MPDRRSFWPTVVLGAGGATLASVASGRPWAEATAVVAGSTSSAVATGSEAVPLALALSLVSLAAWGAVLVVRRRARRVLAGIGLLASAGVLAATALGASRARADAVAALAGQGETAQVGLTAWFVATLVGAGLAAVAFLVAQLKLRDWPEMAARYDAPGSQDSGPDQTDLWKSLDQGHDPTV